MSKAIPIQWEVIVQARSLWDDTVILEDTSFPVFAKSEVEAFIRSELEIVEKFEREVYEAYFVRVRATAHI